MIEVKKITHAEFMALRPIRVSTAATDTSEGTEPTDIFEIDGPEYEIVRAMQEVAPRHVWTLLDVGKKHTVLASGLHRVNRIGYMITQQPAPYEHTECEVK